MSFTQGTGTCVVDSEFQREPHVLNLLFSNPAFSEGLLKAASTHSIRDLIQGGSVLDLNTFGC